MSASINFSKGIQAGDWDYTAPGLDENCARSSSANKRLSMRDQTSMKVLNETIMDVMMNISITFKNCTARSVNDNSELQISKELHKPYASWTFADVASKGSDTKACYQAIKISTSSTIKDIFEELNRVVPSSVFYNVKGVKHEISSKKYVELLIKEDRVHDPRYRYSGFKKEVEFKIHTAFKKFYQAEKEVFTILQDHNEESKKLTEEFTNQLADIVIAKASMKVFKLPGNNMHFLTQDYEEYGDECLRPGKR